MKLRYLVQALASIVPVIACGTASAFSPGMSNDCKTWPTATSDLLIVLGQRAVEAAGLAALPAGRDERRLGELMARDARFNLGGGDVDRDMGRGIAGFRKLMAELQADRYRFDGWDYMSKKESPCGVHEVTVEFSSFKLGERADMTFKFVSGRIIEAKGWHRSMTTGVFPATR